MRHYRRVIHISAEDSPNVRYARAEIARGLKPSNKMIVPGVLTWDEYQKRLATWDIVRQTIGLLGKFYMGAQLLLFPPHWLDNAIRQHNRLGTTKRGPFAIGCDPAEGGDKSAWAIGDLLGLVELVSMQTSDTNVVPNETIRLMAKYNVTPEFVCFDRGGGGYEHACRLKMLGYDVRSIGFGQKVSLDPRAGRFSASKRREAKAEGYVYANRRAQMFGELSERMDPSIEGGGWAIPEGITGDRADPRSELRHQLAMMPKLYDEEQRLRMLPKNAKTEDRDPMGGGDPDTLVGLIGHSPDEADAVALMMHALLHDDGKRKAGAAGYGRMQ